MTRANGFTLIELLAALTAGSLLLVLLSWNVAALSRELRKPVDGGRDANAMAILLRRAVEQALPPLPGGATVAEPDRLELVTSPPDALGAIGPMRAEFQVQRRNGSDSLILAFEPLEPATRLPEAAARDLTVLSGYRDISFSYEDGGREGPHLPALITLNLLDARGSTTRISVAPRINTSGDCRFDPISMTCRP